MVYPSYDYEVTPLVQNKNVSNLCHSPGSMPTYDTNTPQRYNFDLFNSANGGKVESTHESEVLGHISSCINMPFEVSYTTRFFTHKNFI